LTVDVDSFDTGNRTRDNHLRSSDFFQLENHPEVRFVSTRIRPLRPGLLRVEGRLEAAGTGVSLELDATVEPVGEGLEIEATTAIDHGLFGMSSGQLGMIRSPATLHVRARLHR
jgi:polyisoprenoid-binding protein YceI